MYNVDLNLMRKQRCIPSKAKVLVVGAGVSGLYSTYRLLEETDIDDIVILEKSNRTGGRLDSDLIEFPNGHVVKEEEGGMRFLFENMDNLMSLFMELDLVNDIVPFPMNSNGNNRLCFRGESFTAEEAKSNNFEIWSELYNLAPAEQNINPKQIIDTVFNRILQANPQFTDRPKNKGPEFWQKFRLDCCWQNVPLYQWSLWDLLTEMGYTNEAITLLYRLLGFNGTFLSKMNAGVAYQLLEDFPADAEFRTFKEGFSTLPNALVEKVGEERIHLNTLVTNIKATDNGGYVVTYQYTNPEDCAEPQHFTIEAEKVLLCLPRLALEKLFARSDAFNALPAEKAANLWDTLQSTTNQPLLKINLYYDYAWWGNKLSNQPVVEFGPNFADLPTGSIYPFYSISNEVTAGLQYEQSGASPSPELEAKLTKISNSKFKAPAALTIYCDYLNINYWSALQNKGDKYQSPLQNKYSDKQPQTIFPASLAVVKEATRYFKSIFNTHFVPEPVMTSARIWEGSVSFDTKLSQQFGYGVHQWAIGANDREVMATLTEPLDNLYTCGEAFSDYQGWVEGALRSTDLVLEKGFGLQKFSEKFIKDHGEQPSCAIKEAYQEVATASIREYIDCQYEPTERNHCDAELEIDETMSIRLSYFDKE
ncbi:flavin monoamine oxidase family protein [Thaumasiovibrio subtropicus]|uniref:flavin monoamine oxidase family protein n=1 Tax=Thaumasiovibrio subtropicus TaxID=1891207 RepID=UPI000B34FE41|nr:FAD-dependent oxidoreductase [Thaumasiovibrio subtropicus]